MMKVCDLKLKLSKMNDDSPVILVDCRSGVVEAISACVEKPFDEWEANYGVELPIGTPTCKLYVG